MTGVYLHVPFCRRRCDYCDFATWTDRTHLAERYLRACRTHAERAAADLPPITSVFVGGGTPSLVDPVALLAVFEPLPIRAGAEVTIECNPDDVTADLLRAYRDGGVTRISMGVQSMGTGEAQLLTRYLGYIQVQRGDFNGRMLTVRRDDLRTIACILDTSDEGAVKRLDELGLSYSR